MLDNGRVAGSFRDPSGFMFREGGLLYRQVNDSYRDSYDRLMGSGLYDALCQEGLIIPHSEVGLDLAQAAGAYKVLRPELVPFISYPYEWCFGQLRDAALATLRIERLAFDHGMTLKDSSAYNIQFVRGKPLLIDTLSFDLYQDGEPWVAYRQFCQHFLAPLALMAYRDIRLGQLLRVYLDGIPLDLASRLLPAYTWLSFALLSHIHLHAQSQQRFAGQHIEAGRGRMSRLGFLGLIDSLESVVRRLAWQPRGTAWVGYYEETNYTPTAFARKKQIVHELLVRLSPAVVWDLGANTGVFSQMAAELGAQTIALDVDIACVEQVYRRSVTEGDGRLLPLLLDLTNPSPAIGWENQERLSLLDRGRPDVVLALALVHHLAIANNLPLPRVAEFLSRLGDSLIIEFVPKVDSQVQQLLASRQDIFPDYTEAAFREAFAPHFPNQERFPIEASERTLWLMDRG